MLANPGAAWSGVPHSQVLRAACDTCRAQKLRCVIDGNDPMHCVRCKNANRDCYHSPQGRPGRPSIRSHAGNRSGPRGQAPLLSKTRTFQPLQDMQWKERSEHDIVNKASSVGVADDSLAFGPPPRAYAEDFFSYDSTIDDFLMSGVKSASNYEDSFGVPENACYRLEPVQQEAINISTLSWGSQATCTSYPSTSQGYSGHLVTQSTTLESVDERTAKLASDEFAVSDDAHALHLCQLTAMLYTEHGRHPSKLEHFASHVLSSTKFFIKVLASLKQALPSGNAPAPVDSQDGTHPAQPHDTPSSSSVCADEPSASPANPSPLTTPTILHLLSCYLRLMTLHAQLYHSIRLQLLRCVRSRTSGSRCAIPSLFPDCGSGPFSLDTYAAYQYRFFLQVCLHDLGRIEALLGLPRLIKLCACLATDISAIDTEAESGVRAEGPRIAENNGRNDSRSTRRLSRPLLDMEATRGQAGVDHLVRVIMQQAQEKGGCSAVLMSEIAALEAQLRALLDESLAF